MSGAQSLTPQRNQARSERMFGRLEAPGGSAFASAPHTGLDLILRDQEVPVLSMPTPPDAPYKKQKISPERKARTRLAVYQRDGFACRACGTRFPPPADYAGRPALSLGIYYSKADPFRYLELDHVVPEFLGGKFEVDNLQALCTPCNASKGARV